MKFVDRRDRPAGVVDEIRAKIGTRPLLTSFVDNICGQELGTEVHAKSWTRIVDA